MARAYRRIHRANVPPRVNRRPPPAEAEPEAVDDSAELSYRDLQAEAKAAGIPANQDREALLKALGR